MSDEPPNARTRNTNERCVCCLRAVARKLPVLLPAHH